MKHTLALLVLLLLAPSLQAQAPESNPGPLIDKALAAVGGRDKLLTLFRIGEVFHFGDQPEPPAGKQRTKRTSVIEPPLYWWLGTKERENEPAKFDVWAWSLGILTDAKSKVEVIPDLTDEGKASFGLRVSVSVTPAMDLYFDKQTNLLLRLDWRGDFYRFSEWKEHDGVKYASRTIIFKKKDGKPWFFHDVTSVERLKELPANLKRPTS